MSITIVTGSVVNEGGGIYQAQITGSVTVTGVLGQSATMPIVNGVETTGTGPGVGIALGAQEGDALSQNWVSIGGSGFTNNSTMEIPAPGDCDISINGVQAVLAGGTLFTAAPSTTVTSAVDTGDIVPAATDLNLYEFFGGETINVPVIVRNTGNSTVKASVKTYLSTSPSTTNGAIPLPQIPNSNSPLTNITIPAGSTTTVHCNGLVVPESKLVPGTQYYVVCQVSYSSAQGGTLSAQTDASSRTFEFVGTPTKYVAATATKPGHGAQPFFWSNTTVPRGYDSFFDMIENTLSGTYEPQVTKAVVLPNPSATQPQTVTEAFIYQFEGSRLYPYTTSGDQNPTLGIGINLNTLRGKPNSTLANDLVADVIEDYAPAAQLKTSLIRQYGPAAAKPKINPAVLNLLTSSGVLNNPKVQVLTPTHEWELFREALSTAMDSAQSAYKGDWSRLTPQQQAALVDINYNTGSNFDQMLQDLASGDTCRAVFDLVNAYRTTQPGNLGLNTRTEADLQMLVYSNPDALGSVLASIQ